MWAGKPLFCEKPFIRLVLEDDENEQQLLHEGYNRLSGIDKATIDNLDSAHDIPVNLYDESVAPWKAMAWTAGEASLESRWLTNAHNLGPEGGSCLFGIIPKINHDCMPNCVLSWDAETQQGVVFAVKDIQVGEELVLSYVDTFHMKDERRSYLRRHFGFHCSCSTCCSNVGDENRKHLGNLYRDIEEQDYKESGKEKRNELIQKLTMIVKLMEEEHLVDVRLAEVQNMLSLEFEKQDMLEEAVSALWKAAEVYKMCLGEDHELFTEVVAAVTRLEDMESKRTSE
ncbi:uncharacterized protein K452DRAFT_49096 [Aplosporella prunicola CBS 121167]|uniref:SET domain-containing protein n=1 Tax=Aplosporella prunicola CBS 121167 TaxID=1176127 RepID=A0A6A6B8W1_9PEZI|nr:uncharacterized protein K452DRAFT_49096 [Aplosporella prunicola CBS 121167]KAF2140619.1 hypothetical protein K452DRAFT_49096 [Aplosporella prunicola CBS 121167]